MDDIPYIIVDNQRIPPIQPSHRPPRKTGHQTAGQADSFGIVDRVTLSTEGLRRSREQQTASDAPPAIAGNQTVLLLTYSPRRLR